MQTQPDQLPLVTIVMSTFNRATLLLDALNAIARMNPPAYEVIVIDDGSTDDTPEVLGLFDTLVIHERQINRGKSYAINRAVAKATGDWIWICDDDDCVVENAVTIFAQSIQDHSSADFHYALLGDLVAALNGTFVNKGRGTQVLPAPVSLYCALLAGIWIPCLPSIIVRRSVFTAIGGLREDLKRVEDEHFALKLVCDHQGASIPAIIYYVRKHDGERGTADSRFPNLMREDIDLRYFQIIYRELIETSPLAAYCCEATEQLRLPTEPQLFRLVVAFRACLWDKVLEELKSLDHFDPGQTNLFALEFSISRLVSEFSTSKTDGLLSSPLYIALQGTNDQSVIQSIGRGILRGIYWSIRGALRNRAINMSMIKLRQLLYASKLLLNNRTFIGSLVDYSRLRRK